VLIIGLIGLLTFVRREDRTDNQPDKSSAI
jgi:hypothetical protein